MQKLSKYTILATGIMLLFYFWGIGDDAGILNMLLNIGEFTFADFWGEILTITVATGGVVGLSIITKNVELAAMSTFVPFYGALIFQYLAIYNEIYEINQFIAIMLFAPLTFLLGKSLLDYWRGRD